MREACESQKSLYKIAQWATKRANGIKKTMVIPTLKRDARVAQDPQNKAELLKETHFPPSVKAKLDDIEGFIYPERVEMPNRLIEAEITQVIRQIKKDKALEPDEIPNRILHIVVETTSAFFMRVF